MIDRKRLSVRDLLLLDGAMLLASWASRAYKGRRHLSIGVNAGDGLCGFNTDPGFERACSKRCAAVREHLETVARYLGCEVSEFYPAKRRKGKAA